MVTAQTGVMERREAVSTLVASRGEALVVSGLGSPSYDVFACGDRDDNYYLWGAMGSAALMGLGLAQAQPNRRVMVVTGDGEQLMAFGSLATIAVARPDNLDIFVLDNQHFGETGMQESHTGRGIDLAAVAAACGFAQTGELRSLAALNGFCNRLAESEPRGPRFYVLKIRAENVPRVLPPRDACYVKNRFRVHLGFEPC